MLTSNTYYGILLIMGQPIINSANIQNIIMIDPKIVWIVLIAVLIIFSIVSTIIFYHWFTYSYKPKIIARVAMIYLIGSGIIVLTAIISAVIYTFFV